MNIPKEGGRTYATGQMAEGVPADQAAHRGQRGLRQRPGHRQRPPRQGQLRREGGGHSGAEIRRAHREGRGTGGSRQRGQGGRRRHVPGGAVSGVRLGAALALAALMLSLSACSSAPKKEEETLFAMDTVMSLTLYGDNARDALAQATDTLEQLDELWSPTQEDSQIWAVNHSGGSWTTVDGETSVLIKWIRVGKKEFEIDDYFL